jgi:hypothetical protein
MWAFSVVEDCREKMRERLERDLAEIKQEIRFVTVRKILDYSLILLISYYQ